MADRIEKDLWGEVRVPADRLWGAQTQRSLDAIAAGRGRVRWSREVIRAIGMYKKCAAVINLRLGLVDASKSAWIEQAAAEVQDGNWDDEFPLTVYQSGSGTHSNMNANEVIANRAIQLAGGVIGSKRPVHPNDDVNRSQSSNDVFPSVMHMATVEVLERDLLPAARNLCRGLCGREEEFAGIVMTGRTHLQDATPIELGQVVSGWRAQVRDAAAAIERSAPELLELAAGGTAVGTGLNAPANFGREMAEAISRETGRDFREARNKFAALSAHDAMVRVSGELRSLAAALTKVANDIRWYVSGPRAGLGELSLPQSEPGSSIMPGKVNPTQCEVITQVAAQVFGNDATVAFAGSQGHFQLSTFKPVILHNVLESAKLLAEAMATFDARVVRQVMPERERIRDHLDRSLMLVTALSPHIGYDKAAEIAHAAHRDGSKLRDAALASGAMSGEEFDAWVRPERMTHPAN